MILVLTEDIIQYDYVNNLGITLEIIKRNYLKKDPYLFLKFYKLCLKHKPDIIHTWGSMLAFYSLPVVIFKKIPHINSHITNAPLKRKKFGFQYWITNIGFKYSTIILANSYAGLKSYGVSIGKGRVIYNGIRLERFTDLPDKELIKTKFNIPTPFAVIMVATYAANKNYRQLVDIAEFVSHKRDDITFIGVGDSERDFSEFEKIKELAAKLNNLKLCEKLTDVESLINACDIGVLFTYSEGLSNSVIEYMACGKPVIANDAGGTREIVFHDQTGFLLTNETTEEIADLIVELIDDENKRSTMGKNAKRYIGKYMSIDRIGKDFCKLYSEIAENKG
jgi:glycosyltransferase involved in cell wall biosynthesis